MTLGYQQLKRLRALRDGLSRIVRPQSLVFPGSTEEGRLPLSPLDGVDVADASLALVGTLNREQADKFFVWLQVGTVASGDEWEATFAPGVLGEGDSIAFVSTTDDATVYAEQIAAELEAFRLVWNGDEDKVVWESVELLPDEVTIRLRFAGWVRVEINNTASAGPESNLRMLQEAETVSFEAYGLEPASSTWVRIESSSRTFSGQGGSVPIDVSGFVRVFVSVLSTEGVCIPFVAVSTASDNAADLISAATTELATLRATIPTKLADPAFAELQGGLFGAEPLDFKVSTSDGPDLYHALRGALLGFLSYSSMNRLTPERLSRLSRSVSDFVAFVPLFAETAAVLPDLLAIQLRNRPDLYAELQRRSLETIEGLTQFALPSDPDELLELILAILDF